MSARTVILRRHLGRLRSNRSVIIGLIFGALILTLLLIATTVVREPLSKAEENLVYQYALWKNGMYSFLVLVFSTVLGSSLANDDIKGGTIFGVLARPVSRTDYFVGSFLGAAIFVVVLESMRIVPSIGASLIYSGGLTPAFALAMIAVLLGNLLWLAFFAAVGAVFSTATSLLLGILAILVTGLAFAPDLPSWLTYPMRIVAAFLPLSGESETVYKSIVGESQGFGPLVEVIAYRLCWTLALALLGAWGFSRREIAPRT